MTKYVTVSIGNTDNRLTQQEWSYFVRDVGDIARSYGKIHFFGGAPNWAQWQNAAWLIEMEPKEINMFMSLLSDIRNKYKQDSAFFMVGEGLFI